MYMYMFTCLTAQHNDVHADPNHVHVYISIHMYLHAVVKNQDQTYM